MVNLRTFDLNLLRVFEAIHHDRSVSIAADKLGLSQPAVSNALNRLRQHLDDPLFVRTTKGMEPTPKAEDLAAAVQLGLTTLRSGLSAGARFDPAESTRHFTVLMTDVGELSFLPGVLRTLSRSAPSIDIRVIEYGVEGYSDLLENGLADLAVGRVRLTDTLSNELIHTNPFVVLTSCKNPLLETNADGDCFMSWENYMSAAHVLVEPRGATGNPVLQALGQHASQRRIALTIPHATVLPMIMDGTDLVATIPKVCAAGLMAGRSLCAVLPPFEIEPNLVYQWWHRRNTDDLSHKWLRQIFAAAGV
jgi:DNA-binding transcriptional LysR family regulator